MQNSDEQQSEGVPARVAALKMLDAILRRGQTMDNAAQHARDLPPADAALASAIVGETLRRLPDIDALIDSATRMPLADDAKARMVLRLALAQKIGSTPPTMRWWRRPCLWSRAGRASWSTACLAHCCVKAFPRSNCPCCPARCSSAGRGRGGRRSPPRRGARSSPVPRSTSASRATRSIRSGTALAPRQRRLDASSPVAKLPGFDEGGWWVQDLAASLPARMVPADAKRVLDACAAPGGKTMQLAAAGHEVTALDRSESRLARLAENLARTGLKAETVVGDVREWTPDAPYDAVLLDAPCSATGTFRRHPEVLYRARPEIIVQMAAFQAELLLHAADWVRPGGSLIYAVCSLEPEEGEAQIDAFLAERPDYRIEPAVQIVDGVTPDKKGRLRILPGMIEDKGGLDGFFAVHLVRGGD